MVTLRTTNSDNKNPTFSIFVFRADLRTNSSISPILQQLIGLYNRACVFTARYGLDLHVKFRSVFKAKCLSSLAQAVLVSTLQDRLSLQHRTVCCVKKLHKTLPFKCRRYLNVVFQGDPRF